LYQVLKRCFPRYVNLPELYLNVDIETGSGIIVPMLHIEYTHSSSVAEPFPVEIKSISCEGSIVECLGLLFPAKEAYYRNQHPGRLIITALPHAPFGVSPEVLAGFLFDDIGEEFRFALERFDLGDITVTGLPEFSKVDVRGVFYRAEPEAGQPGIRLDLLEFRRLISAVREGKVSSGLLLNIFKDPGNVYSFFVPEGITLGRLFESRPELSSGDLYEPYTGKILGPGDELYGPAEHALVYSDSKYTASPGGSNFFAFPWFNSRIAMRKTGRFENTEQPCVNCLVCGDHCPADLSPSILYHQIIKGGLHDTPALDLFACTGCGLCSFVCPSSLPLCDEITGAIDKLNEESDG